MAKLIEAYSRNTGLEIKKPFLLEKFYPIDSEKYITLQTGSGMSAKNYDYWQEVVLQIKQILDKNKISIILLGSPEDQAIQGVIDLRGKTNIHQSNYIIKRSLLHIGNDSCLAHIAGANNIPLICLYGSTTIENHSPYWFNKDKTILIESHRFGRNPTFASQETPKSINLIKPEQIIDSIYKLLEINDFSKKDTIYIGSQFQNIIVEYIPNCDFNAKLNGELPIILRMDYHFEIKGILQLAQKGYKFNLITDKPIDINLLKQIKQFITNLTIEVSKFITVDYIKQLKNAGIKFTLFIKEENQDVLSKIRFKFLDVAKIEQLQSFTLTNFKDKVKTYQNKEIDLDVERMYFQTNKIIVANGKAYPSKIHFKKDMPFNPGERVKTIDDPLFWEDIEYFNTFYAK